MTILLDKFYNTLEKLLFRPLAVKDILAQGHARTEVLRNRLLQLEQAKYDATRLQKGEIRVLPNGGIIELQPCTSEVMLSGDLPNRIEPTFDIKSLTREAQQRDGIDSIKRHINLNVSLALAESEILNSTENYTEEPVSDDWLHRWKEYAQSVSEEKFQLLWAKILAGEVHSPGRFSLRTLQTLHNLSPDEASGIQTLANFTIGASIYKTKRAAEALSVDFLLQYEELGVLTSIGSEIVQRIANQAKNQYRCGIGIGNRFLIITHESPFKTFVLDCYNVSKVGRELISLCAPEADEQHLREIGLLAKAEGFSVKIAHGHMTTPSHATVSYSEDL